MIEQIFVDDCPACEPVNRLISTLLKNGFEISEQRLDDYHFHQLYFKLQGNLNFLKRKTFAGFTKKKHTYYCHCHWTTVEMESEI
jgi:hypothetical protein